MTNPKQNNQTVSCEQIVKNNIIHLEKLQKIGIETFGEKLWKPEIYLLKSLQKECITDRRDCKA